MSYLLYGISIFFFWISFWLIYRKQNDLKNGQITMVISALFAIAGGVA